MINSKGEEYLVLGQEKAKFSFKDVSLTGKDVNEKIRFNMVEKFPGCLNPGLTNRFIIKCDLLICFALYLYYV